MPHTRVSIHSSAGEIDSRAWQSLSDNPYESRGWFLAHEQYFVRTRFIYFCARSGNDLMAVLPVYDQHSVFYANTLTMMFSRAQPVMRRMRFLICGAPLSFLSDPIGDAEAGEKLLSELDNYARKKGADFVSMPFSLRPSGPEGWLTRPSMKDYDLYLPGDRFEDYVASFRSNKRNRIRKEVKSAAPVKRLPLAGVEEQIAEYRNISAARYGRDQHLDPRFYKLLSGHFGGAVQVLQVVKEGRVPGVTSYFKMNSGFYFFHVGIIERDGNYFNLNFYEPIRIAYESGVHFLNYRPGSGTVKMDRGCIPVQKYLHYKPCSTRAQAVLWLKKRYPFRPRCSGTGG